MSFNTLTNNNFRQGFANQWVRTKVNVMQPTSVGNANPPRKWQAECFEYLGDSNPVSIINAPMGSGKSTTLCMIAYNRLIKNKNLKAIIVVPENLIGKGFGEKLFSLPDGTNVDWSAQVNLILNKDSTVQQLKSFITEDLFYSNYYLYSRICVCTNQTLCKAFESLTEDEKATHWKNLVILFDEAHHVRMDKKTDEIYEMNSLGQVLDFSYRNENEILLMTASLFRGDKKSILSDEILKDSLRFNLSFYEYWSDMKHLQSLKYDFVVGVNQYTEDISDAFKILSEDRLSKQIIFIPHPSARMSTGKNGKYKEIEDILEKKRIELDGDLVHLDKNTGIYHITNSSGLNYKVADLVSENLSKRVNNHIEKADINKNKDAIDCIIALNRANEGFDWIHADGMIIVGVRHSTTRLYQMIGRLLRDVPNKPIVKVVHMLDFAPHLPVSPNLENSLNDSLKFLYATFLLLDVMAPRQVEINDMSSSSGQSGKRDSYSNIFDDLEIDLNLRADLLSNSIRKLASKFNEGHVENLRDFMPDIVGSWLGENNIAATDDEIEKLADKVWNTFPKTSQSGINLSEIDIKLCESIGPLGFLMRFSGLDITLESCAKFSAMVNQGEFESNKRCHIVCIRMKEYGYPALDYNDEEHDFNHYGWIHNKKQAKQGKGETAWYESDLAIAKSYGFDTLFDLIDERQKNLDNTQYCINYAEAHPENKYPTRWSGTDEDKQKAEWLTRQKSTNKKNKYFSECVELAISKGHPNLFKNIDREEEMLKKIFDLLEWVKKNGAPKKDSTGLELTYYGLVGTLRKAKNGKSENVWYDSFDQIFEKYDMWDLIMTQKEKSLHKCSLLINFMKQKEKISPNDVLPKSNSSNELEKKLYNYYSKKINENNNTNWHTEEINLLKENDVYKYLKNKSELRIENWLNDIEILSQYVKCNHGKLPSKKTHQKELNTLQEVKRRYANNTLEQIVIDKFHEVEIPHHLQYVDKESEAKKKFIKLCERLKKGSRPSKNSGFDGDVELSSYMSTLMKGLRGNRSFVKYCFYKEIAEDMNVKYYFEGLL